MREYYGVWDEVKTERALRWKHEVWSRMTFNVVKDYLQFNNIVKPSDSELKEAFRGHERILKELGYMGRSVSGIDLAVVKLNKVKFIKIDISEAKYIRDKYFRKRRSIQSKTSEATKAKLLAKYSGRERRRINDILHRATKIIAGIIAEENAKPVMEKLTHIRERIRYSRKMNRRLHSMPFRKNSVLHFL